MFVKERVEPAGLGVDDRADHEALGCLKGSGTQVRLSRQANSSSIETTDYQVRMSLLGL
jgi:hypothetical protein